MRRLRQEPSVSDNRIFDNEAFLQGGGVRFCYFWGTVSRPRVEHNVISNNRAMDGAGIHCDDVNSLTITECAIVDNVALDYGGGMMVEGQGLPGLVRLDRCTLRGNTAAAYRGGGVHAEAGVVELSSCIVTESVGCGLVVGQGVPQPALFSDYCDVWSNQPADYHACVPGSHSISLDPMFCDTPPARALWIDADSPCVGTGQGGVNMGAYPDGCETTNITACESAPSGIHLRIHPNPVLQRARFTFDTTTRPLTLEIYDPSGRLVEKLQPTSTLSWKPGDRAPRGIYFARMRGEGVSEVVKFVVLR